MYSTTHRAETHKTITSVSLISYQLQDAGSAEPIETNGAEDKSLSRRVVFKIRVKSAEQRAFETNLGLSDVKQIGQ